MYMFNGYATFRIQKTREFATKIKRVREAQMVASADRDALISDLARCATLDHPLSENVVLGLARDAVDAELTTPTTESVDSILRQFADAVNEAEMDSLAPQK